MYCTKYSNGSQPRKSLFSELIHESEPRPKRNKKRKRVNINKLDRIARSKKSLPKRLRNLKVDSINLYYHKPYHKYQTKNEYVQTLSTLTHNPKYKSELT